MTYVDLSYSAPKNDYRQPSAPDYAPPLKAFSTIIPAGEISTFVHCSSHRTSDQSYQSRNFQHLATNVTWHYTHRLFSRKTRGRFPIALTLCGKHLTRPHYAPGNGPKNKTRHIPAASICAECAAIKAAKAASKIGENNE